MKTFFFFLALHTAAYATTATIGTTTTQLSTGNQNTLVPQASGQHSYPQFLLNAVNDGVATWTLLTTASTGIGVQSVSIVAAIYTGGAWLTPTELGTGSSPIAGIDGTGTHAYVAWVNGPNLTNSNIQIAQYTFATASWSVITLTSVDINNSPSLFVNALGVAAMTWLAYPSSPDSTTETYSVQLSAYDGTSAWLATNWSTPAAIVTPTGPADLISNPTLSLDNTIIATGVHGQVVWQDTNILTPGYIFAKSFTVTTP